MTINQFVSRYFFNFLFFAALLLSQNAHAEIRKTIQEMVLPYGYIDAEISPDSKHLAIIEFNGTQHTLLLLDIESKVIKTISTSRRVQEGFWIISKQPRAVTWVNNSMLAVDYGIQTESINLEGKLVAFLGESEYGISVLGKVYPEKKDSTELLIKMGGDEIKINIVDAQTGKTRKINLPDDGKLIDWAFDRSGQIRVATYLTKGAQKDTNIVSHWYKSPSTEIWEKLESFKSTDDYWQVMYVPDEKDSIVVSARNERDTRAIFLYNTQLKKMTEMMAGHPTQDILKVTGLNQKNFESVTTNGLKPQQVWFDDVWRSLQASVDQALPDSINRISGNPKKAVLVYSSSDVNPGSWSIVEIEKMNMTEIGKFKMAVNRTTMHKMSTFSYLSTDGLKIPSYLTHPTNIAAEALLSSKETKALPMVVLIHGGPITRDYWRWNIDVQLLASEGYVVFQPQFRGSTGFGKKFETAGYGQWGLMMQDDITAGVEYLIEHGIADRNKICIYGSSYGGYAAMWGLVKTPDLYRCGVSFAGVVDINFMFNDSSDTNSNSSAREFLRFTVGDHTQIKELFETVSPLKNASKIKAPLLISHGDSDRRVPISHSKKMMNALKNASKTFDWLELEDEGHGIHYTKNEVLYYSKS